MIKNATKNMLPQLIKLWKACFGDCEEYSSLFFSQKMIGTDIFQNQLVYVEDDKVVSMLSILPAGIIQECGLKKFWYIYGVATAEEYRKRGYAKKLIQRVLELAEQEDVVVGLVPANESLYSYYEKFGFHTFFYKRKLVQNVIEEDLEQIEFNIETILSNEYYNLRNEVFQAKGTIVWDLPAVEYALAENKVLGGEALKVIENEKEYFLLCYEYEGILLIRETNLPDSILFQVSNQLAKKYACEKIVISMCVFNKISAELENESIVRHGMIFNGENIGNRGYLGLALD